MMTPLALAHAFLKAFSAADIPRLRSLLADDLVFRGPFARFDSADDYAAVLAQNPPRNVTIETLAQFETGNAACVWTLFRKPGIESKMVQLFEVREGHIARITLVFDSADFA